MNILKRLLEPVPFDLELSNRVAVDPDTVRRYVSDPATLDKYCPGLTHTTVTPTEYRSSMKWLGVDWRADMTYHPTSDGVVLEGKWSGPVLPSFGETLTLRVRPDESGHGSVFSKTENYRFPRFLAPTFPFLRYGLTRVSHQSAAKLEAILQGQPTDRSNSMVTRLMGSLRNLAQFAKGSTETFTKAGLPAIQSALHGDDSPVDFKDRYGPWAVVTGASGSIGGEFARQLAAKGVNVVLAARASTRLDNAARQLHDTYGVQVRTVASDLSKPDAAAHLDEATRDLDVGLLINAAGAFQTGAFLGQDTDKQAELVDFNVKTPMLLAHHFGERLAQRHQGGLMLISAGSAFQGVPTVANYAASKAYVLSLAEGLAPELRPSGVDVMAVVIGPTPETSGVNSVTSQGVDFKRSPIPTTTPQEVVKTALADLGHKTCSMPGFYNRAAFQVQQHLLSRDLNSAMAGYAVARLQGYDSVDHEIEATS